MARVRTYEVLCRIDAYADYVAKVRASTPERAAEFARDNHERYKWAANGIAEFDARFYVTLDENGCEIDSTHTGEL